jgi:hypothetical protein
MRFKLGVAAILGVTVAVNGVLLWLAIQHPPEMVESYAAEAR